MKKEKTTRIIIDLNKWQTQTQLAKEKGCSVEYICKLIRLGKLNTWKIPELGLHLVEK
jgi:hypothetical protein